MQINIWPSVRGQVDNLLNRDYFPTCIMLSVGRLLREARLKQGITLIDVEHHTRIRGKYLVALESDDFSSLPGRAYIAGFIRNYSEFLKLDSEHVLAVFRREFSDHKRPTVLPKGLAQPVNRSPFTLTPRIAAFFATGLLLFVFFAYLFFEYRYVAIAPVLSLTTPSEGQKIQSSSVLVQGKSDPDAEVTINDQTVSLQVDGTFSVEVSLKPGLNKIIVSAKNKFGKKADITRMIEGMGP